MHEIHPAGGLLSEGLGEGTVGDGKMKTVLSAESDLQIRLSDPENKLSPWKHSSRENSSSETKTE